MKKDEQANVLLSLKNLYRLFTVKDYPVYSTGILGEKSKKGLTLVSSGMNIFSMSGKAPDTEK